MTRCTGSWVLFMHNLQLPFDDPWFRIEFSENVILGGFSAKSRIILVSGFLT